MLSNLGISLTTAGFLLTACPLISAEPTDVQTAPVYLYGVEFTRPSFELKIAKETYELIQKSIEPRKLIVRNVTTSGLDEAIKERKADIVITNSGIYRRYLQNGWRDVLTLATGVQPNPDQAVGSLILANKKLGINTIEDLKGHSIALNTPSAFHRNSAEYQPFPHPSASSTQRNPLPQCQASWCAASSACPQNA